MVYNNQHLEAGLYMVATPIGSARDITLRALDILANCDVIAAEDTRTARKLLEIHGVPLNGRKVIAYHEHSGTAERQGLMKLLQSGKSVAYVSEAGTPLVADPGFQLVRDAIERDLPVVAAPGASALLTALSVSGLPTDRFFFAGFLPSAQKARKDALAELKDVPGTLVFYESPRRVEALLQDVEDTLGGQRAAVIGRELTKKFEEHMRGDVTVLKERVSKTPLKGECVVMIGRAHKTATTEQDLREMLKTLLLEHRVKEASSILAETVGLPRRDIYSLALQMKEEARKE